MSAQNSCMTFFPNNDGAVVVSSTYDNMNNLLRTMTYRVNSVSGNTTGSYLDVNFTMADRNGSAISDGRLDANCYNGNFAIRMVTNIEDPAVMDILSNNTEMIANFLDYPNTFDTDNPFLPNSLTETSDFYISSKNDNHDNIRVKILNRQFVKDEKISTPVGEFDATKMSFDFETTKSGNTTRYKGVEWYAPNAGVVRSETYDNNNNLLNYTVITTLKDR